MNRPAIGGPFKLIDTENRAVTESDLRGNWTLIYFGYTSCPDVGPKEVQKMANVIDILGEISHCDDLPTHLCIAIMHNHVTNSI